MNIDQQGINIDAHKGSLAPAPVGRIVLRTVKALIGAEVDQALIASIDRSG